MTVGPGIAQCPLGDLRGKRVTVMGLGVFGGGAGVTRFLARRGARVCVTDRKSPEELETSLVSLVGFDVEYALGGHREEDFTDADLVETKHDYFKGEAVKNNKELRAMFEDMFEGRAAHDRLTFHPSNGTYTLD